MRVLLAVAFVVVTSVAAFTYRDLVLNRHETVRRPVPAPPRPVALAAPVQAAASPGVAEVLAVDSLQDEYIMAVQADPLDVRPMTDLAFLYMKHGWFERAIGPLARAREIDPTSEPLRRYLELALARSAGGAVDLDAAARQFVEMVEMWGMGC